MIRSFRCRPTQKLHLNQSFGRFRSFERVARRKLAMLDAAIELRDLKAPPGNRLEALKGNRKGQHSIRINDQWRICFRWHTNDAYDVEIIDYH